MLIEFGAWMVDLLEEHFEEAAFLWMQRQAALTSPAQWPVGVRRLEARLAAHTDALVLAGPAARTLLEPKLAGDAGEALAAAHVLLLGGTEWETRLVLAALREADGPALEGLRLALCLTPIQPLLADVREVLRTAPPPAATVAAEALATHGETVDPQELDPLLRAVGPAVRIGAWRAAAALGRPLEPSLYANALRDDEAGVRFAALLAAAWSGVPGALHVARQAAADPAAAPREMLRLLAIIGAPEDAPLVARLGTDPALGPARFELLASYGRPDSVDTIIEAMSDEDPATAAAAGVAFRRMTGVDVDTGRTTAARGDDVDDVEAEFEEDVMVPDAPLAREAWDGLRPSVSAAVRLCGGLDVDQPLTPDMLDTLDMLSRMELGLRRRFRGRPAVSAASVHRYPLDQSGLLA